MVAYANEIGDRGVMFLAVTYVLTSIGLALICLRSFAASKTPDGKWRWDFIWAVLATLFVVPAVGTSTVAVLYGMGQHMSKLAFPQMFKAAHFNYISLFAGQPALNFAKFSVIALLTSVQGPDAKKRKWFLWFLGGLAMSGSIIQTALSLTSCEPMEKLWKPVVPGSCPRSTFSYQWNQWQGVQHGVIDVILALWPISIVWNLKTSRNVKIGFCLLMAVGILPGAASFVRVTQLRNLRSSRNVTYDMPLFTIWTMVEAWLGIILSCVPPLRPLFLRVVYGIKSSSKGSRSGTRPTGGLTGRSGTRTQRGDVEDAVPLKEKDVHVNARAMGSNSPGEVSGEEGDGGIMISTTYTVNKIPTSGK